MQTVQVLVVVWQEAQGEVQAEQTDPVKNWLGVQKMQVLAGVLW